MIINFESGNYDLFEYRVRSFYRSLLKKKDIREFDKFMLDFFRNTMNVINEMDVKENFRELLWKVKPMKDKPELENLRTYFDFEEWIESKM